MLKKFEKEINIFIIIFFKIILLFCAKLWYDSQNEFYLLSLLIGIFTKSFSDLWYDVFIIKKRSFFIMFKIIISPMYLFMINDVLEEMFLRKNELVFFFWVLGVTTIKYIDIFKKIMK